MTIDANTESELDLDNILTIHAWAVISASQDMNGGTTNQIVLANRGAKKLLRDWINQQLEAKTAEARLNERKQVALDNYHGHTFSEATNYKGKFDKFIENNERRIAHLTNQTKDKETV